MDIVRGKIDAGHPISAGEASLARLASFAQIGELASRRDLKG